MLGLRRYPASSTVSPAARRDRKASVPPRAPGLGTRRIQMELARHGLKLSAQPLQQLRDSELERAMQLWRRKFGAPAQDLRERARQMRFLAGRGFPHEVVRRILGGEED